MTHSLLFQQSKNTFYWYFVLVVVALIFSCKKDPVNTASISGTITHTGTAIPGTTLTLSSKSINYTAYSSTSGKFDFTGLPRGDYKIEARFQKTLSTTSLTTSAIVANGALTAQINKDGEKIIANIELSWDTVITQTGGGGGGGGSSGSCPYIYAYNGQSYVFNGDIYAGAIYPCLERHDYTRLNGMLAVDGKYRIKIANKLEIPL